MDDWKLRWTVAEYRREDLRREIEHDRLARQLQGSGSAESDPPGIQEYSAARGEWSTGVALSVSLILLVLLLSPLLYDLLQ